MKWLRILLGAILLLFLQMAIFNHLHLWGLCHPFVYILLLLCMPLMPRWAEILTGFALGCLMDCICSTPGIHTSACVLISWLRPIMLSRMVQDSERLVSAIVPETIGVLPFVRLTVILTLLHHLWVFALDTWSWQLWYWVLLQVVFSSIITLGCIFAYGFLIHRS